MSKKNDDIKALLNEFKAEQKRFKEEQRLFKEEQNKFKSEQKVFNEKQEMLNGKQEIFNKQVTDQNKRNKRGILVVLSISLVFSGVTSVFSYTLGASSVGYTSRDSNWNVSNAQEAIDNLFDSVGSSLVGSVYSYMGVSAPPGYLACDGSEYNIEDYPRLANHINRNFGSVNYFGGNGETTFAVPDLRGEFLRGTGTNSHTNSETNSLEGSGANVGTHQSATVERSTYHQSQVRTSKMPSNIDTGFISEVEFTYTNGTKWTGTSDTDRMYTSRPTNTSVLYIIKY